MSSFQHLLSLGPKTLIKSNGTSLADISRSNTSISGNYVSHLPISTGSQESIISNPASPVNFGSPNTFVAGSEMKPFALVVRALENTNNKATSQALISHQGAYDGLALIGDELRFTIEFDTLDPVVARYPLPVRQQAMDIVANYLVNKVQLYVNGQMVSEVEISEDQISDGFKPRASNNLYVGHNSTANYARSTVVDGIAIFEMTLSDQEINKIYSLNSVDEQPWQNPYSSVSFDWKNRELHNPVSFPHQGWHVGLSENVNIVDNALRPTLDFDTNTSQVGTWTYAYDIDSYESNIYGIQVSWEGQGDFAVLYSDNNFSTSTPLVSGQIVPGTFNFISTGKTPLIRVAFSGGIVDDDSVVESLTIQTYINEIINSDNYNRSAILADGNTYSPEHTYDQKYMDFSERGGLRSFGSVLISSDSDVENPVPLRTVEMVVRFDETMASQTILDLRPGGGTEYLSTNASSNLTFPSGTLFVNGKPVSSGAFQVAPGRIYHIEYTMTADRFGSVTLPQLDKTILFINFYSTPQTAVMAKRTFLAMNNAEEADVEFQDSIAISDGPVYADSGAWGMTFTP
jgi:hypothetical protein